jgi:hypothetical protein
MKEAILIPNLWRDVTRQIGTAISQLQNRQGAPHNPVQKFHRNGTALYRSARVGVLVGAPFPEDRASHSR